MTSKFFLQDTVSFSPASFCTLRPNLPVTPDVSWLPTFAGKDQWPQKRLTQTFPGVSRSLPQRCGLAVACCRVVGSECNSTCMGSVEGGLHYLHYFHHSWNQSWIFNGRTDAETGTPKLWPPNAKKMAHWKRLWCWNRMKAGGEGDDRGSDSWVASPTQGTWVWVNSGNWWWTGKPSGCKELDMTERLNWTEKK